jgi:hypothetical protein
MPKLVRARLASPQDDADVNSGFIIAYDIAHAVGEIKKHPIGPMRPVN